MSKLKFDSTSSIKGILFQFLIALERCFKMQEGQSIYIETYGDVSVLGDLLNSKQIESKFYKRPLTDLDKNVWKSISNWISKDFPIDAFSSLVLLTTQKVPIGSTWLNWNEKDPSKRLETLINIKKSFDLRQRKDKNLAIYMNIIFDAKNAMRLSQIVKMLYIDSISMDGNQYHKYLQEKYGKNIPDIQKGRFINHMFGYILNPDIVSHNWRITYEDFTKETEEVTKTLVENTAVFPAKLKLADIQRNDYDGYAFVEKIKDIKYEDVIPDAIDDYVHTVLLIEQELRESLAIRTQFEEYEKSVERRYRTEYRKACRINETREPLKRSQDLYDNVTLANDGTFHTYNSVPSYFHNGVMQILADDKDDIVWLLKGHKDE